MPDFGHQESLGIMRDQERCPAEKPGSLWEEPLDELYSRRQGVLIVQQEGWVMSHQPCAVDDMRMTQTRQAHHPCENKTQRVNQQNKSHFFDNLCYAVGLDCCVSVMVGGFPSVRCSIF